MTSVSGYFQNSVQMQNSCSRSNFQRPPVNGSNQDIFALPIDRESLEQGLLIRRRDGEELLLHLSNDGTQMQLDPVDCAINNQVNQNCNRQYLTPERSCFGNLTGRNSQYVPETYTDNIQNELPPLDFGNNLQNPGTTSPVCSTPQPGSNSRQEYTEAQQRVMIKIQKQNGINVQFEKGPEGIVIARQINNENVILIDKNGNTQKTVIPVATEIQEEPDLSLDKPASPTTPVAPTAPVVPVNKVQDQQKFTPVQKQAIKRLQETNGTLAFEKDVNSPGTLIGRQTLKESDIEKIVQILPDGTTIEKTKNTSPGVWWHFMNDKKFSGNDKYTAIITNPDGLAVNLETNDPEDLEAKIAKLTNQASKFTL